MSDLINNIPENFIIKWQNIADLLAKLMDIPAALILKAENECMEVFISSNSNNNPYHPGDKEKWHELYCETVIKTQKELLVPNALKDKNWDKNPGIKQGMIAYLGIPLRFPNNQPFGTICVLDNKENKFSIENKALLYQFKNVIELDLALIQSLDLNKSNEDLDIIQRLLEQNEEYLAVNEELQQTHSQLIEEKEKFAENEKELLQRHSLMDYMVKNDPKGIAVFDKGLNFIYVSERFLSDYNLTNQNVIGKHHYEVFPEIPDKWKMVHQRVLKGEIIKESEDVYIRSDGTVEYTRWECRPWKHYDESIGGIIVYTEMITEWKQTQNQLKDSEEKFRKAFYTNPELVTISRLDTGKYVSVNQGFANILGYSEAEALGKSSLELQVWNSAEKREHFINLIQKNHIVENYEASFKSKSGKIYDCLVSASTISIDNIPHLLSITRDITERKQLEDSTRKAYDLIKNLAAQVPGVIYQYRLYPDGRSAFPFSSEGMYDIYEVTPEEVKEDASPVFTRIHPDDFDNIVESINKSARNQTVYHNKFRVILPKQGLRWRLCNAQPELLEDGSTLWHGVIMDITDEKIKEDLLKEKSEEINTFFDCALDLLCIADTQGNFIRLNKEWENVLGYSLDELEGKKFMDFMHPDDVDPILQAMNQLKKQQMITNFTNRYLCKDGTYKWIEWKSTTVGNRIYTAARDITDKISTNEELVIAKEKAEEGNRLKTEFLNNMSHEIRTPMNGIIGFSELLIAPGLSEEERIYFSKIVQNSSHQLLRIIDDILEISTLETKQEKLNESEFCLNDLLMELFSIFTLKSNERNIPIYVKKALQDKQSQIVTDKTKLNRILSNLLENALKFTNEGYIEFGYFIEKANLVLYVKDTGIGITEKNHRLIFERFSQEDKEISRKYGGLGLGLSISKENAKLLGGDITLKAEKGKGSTFYVSIPYKPFQSKNISTTENFTGNLLKNYTILVAEDEDVNYLYLEILFEEEIDSNYKLIHAKNGKEAIDLCLKNKNIDIVLMDIKMPIMNGHKAIKKIKKTLPNLPIIAQTSYSTESDKQLALKHGYDDFISKPVSKEKLYELINKHLKVK